MFALTRAIPLVHCRISRVPLTSRQGGQAKKGFAEEASVREGTGRISNRRYRARQMRQRSVVPGGATADDRIGLSCLKNRVNGVDCENDRCARVASTEVAKGKLKG